MHYKLEKKCACDLDGKYLARLWCLQSQHGITPVKVIRSSLQTTRHQMVQSIPKTDPSANAGKASESKNPGTVKGKNLWRKLSLADTLPYPYVNYEDQQRDEKENGVKLKKRKSRVRYFQRNNTNCEI